jgi:hypothetical protein
VRKKVGHLHSQFGAGGEKLARKEEKIERLTRE